MPQTKYIFILGSVLSGLGKGIVTSAIGKAFQVRNKDISVLKIDPYLNIEQKYKIGNIYKGNITRIVDFGAFVKLQEGVEGLIHLSQISWEKSVKPQKIFSVSQEVNVKIMEIDKANKKISLSYKETLDNPWLELKKKIEGIEVNADTIITILKYAMEVVELSKAKGEEQRELAIKLVRNVVVDAPISDDKEKLLLDLK